MRTTRRRVLMVDDNHDAAETLAQLVEMLEHDAQVAYDGPGEALPRKVGCRGRRWERPARRRGRAEDGPDPLRSPFERR